MAEIDNLEIKISASAEKASAAIRGLVENLGNLRDGLKGISEKDLGNLEKVSGSLKNISKIKPKTEVKIETKNAEEKVEDLRKKFKDAGKGYSFTGSTEQLEKDISKLESKLDSLYAREDKAISLGNVDSKGFASLEYDISETSNKLEILSQKLSETNAKFAEIPIKFQEMSNFAPKIPEIKPNKMVGEEFLGYNSDAMKAAFGEAAGNIKSWQDAVGRFGESAGRALNSFSESLKKTGSEEDVAIQKVEELRSKFANVGERFNFTGSTEQLEKDISKLESKLDSLYAREDKAISLGNVDSKGFASLEYDISETSNKLDALRNKLEELGKTSGLENISSRMPKISEASESLKTKLSSVGNALKNIGALAGKTLGSIGTFARKSLGNINTALKGMIGLFGKFSGISGIFSRLKEKMSGASSGSKGFAASLKMGLGNIIKYTFSVSTLLAMLNRVKSAFVEGSDNLTQYSGAYNRSISNMTSALATLKNALAAAFSPIINVVAPYITSFINMLSSAANTVGRFFSALTGKNYAVQATSVYKDYAASLDDTSDSAEKASKSQKKLQSNLQDFDKLHVVNAEDSDKDSDKGGKEKGKGGGISPSDMFTTVPIESSISDFAKKIKEAWEKADFTEIGGIIGGKLKKALDSIPWNSIKKKARKIAKSFATLVNGIVETKGLGKSIGKTFGKAISTGFSVVDELGKRLHFDEIGEFIADGIKGTLENIKWDVALSAAKNWGVGLATMLNHALTKEVFEDVGYTIGMGLNTALTFANSLLETFGWHTFGNNIGYGLKKAIETIDWELLGNTFANSVNAIFQTLLGIAETFPWAEFGKKVALALNTALGAIDWNTAFAAAALWGKGIADTLNNALTPETFANVGETLGNIINTVLIFAYNSTMEFDWETFGVGIATGLNEAISTINWEALGATVSEALNALFDVIEGFSEEFDWEGFATKIGGGISEAIRTFDWANAGESIAKFVNGWFKAFKKWFEETDWKSLGKGITTSISSFFDNFDWASVSGMLSSYWKGLLNFFTGLIEGIDWKSLPQKIIDAISDFFDGFDYKGTFSSVGKFIGTAVAAGIDLIKAIGDILGDIGTKVKDYFVGKFKEAGYDKDKSLLENGKAILTGLLNGIIDGVKGIGGWIKDNIFEPFMEGFKSLFGIHSPSKVMKQMGVYLIEGLKNGILSTIGKVSEFFKKLWKDIQNVFANVKPWFGDKFKSGYEAVKTSFSGIGTWFSDRWKDVKNVFNNIKAWFKEKFESAYNAVKSAFNSIGTWFGNRWTDIKNVFANVKTWFSNKFTGAYGAVKTAFKSIGTWFGERWKDVKNAFNNVKSWFGNKFSSAYGAVKSAFKNIGSWFSDKWKSVKNVFTGGKITVKSFFSDAFQNAYNAVTKIWDKIGGYFNGVFKNVLKPIKNIINGVIKGINFVLKAVNAKQIGYWKPDGFSKGTKGLTQDTVGVVNDQPGSTYRELIVPPHGNPFIPKGRNIMLPMEKGTKIMPAKQTKKIMSSMPHFEGGVGDFFSGAWEKVKDFTGNVMDYLSEPKKIVQIAIDKFTNLAGIMEPMLSIAKGAVGKIADGATNFIKKIFEKELKVDYKVGAGVQQWKALAAKALKITGQYSAANLSYLLQQMWNESRGNPNAINLSDSNAKKGTPSKGLMQVIDPTFRSYALAPYNKNIYDPLSNIIASIRYTVRTYGSLYKGWAARGFQGYSEGIGKINLSDIAGYAKGGYPKSGQLFIANENGKSELIGNIGSKPAVANNNQIVESVSKGVSRAVETTLSKVSIKSGRESLDSEKIAKSITESFGKAAKEMSGSVSEAIGNAFSSASKRGTSAEVLGNIGDLLANAEVYFSSEGAAADEAYEQGEDAAGSYADGLNSGWAEMDAWVEEMRNKVENGLLSIGDSFEYYGGDATENYTYDISENLGEASGIADEYAYDMQEKLAGMAESARAGGNAIAESLQYGISEKWEEMKEFLAVWKTALVGTFDNIGELMKKVGQDVITGMIEGIKESWDAVAEWSGKVKNVFSESEEPSGKIGEKSVSPSKTPDASSATSILRKKYVAAEMPKERKRYVAAEIPKEQPFVSAAAAGTAGFGSIGSRASSIGGEQLVNVMSASMANATKRVLAPYLEAGRNVNVSLQGDAKRIFNVVKDENNSIKLRTGKYGLQMG